MLSPALKESLRDGRPQQQPFAERDARRCWTDCDFDNGLGLMINGVQHAYALATHDHHDAYATSAAASRRARQGLPLSAARRWLHDGSFRE